MYTQTNNVNVKPKSYLPEFHVSQNDVGRTLTAHLVSDDGDITIPVGATVTMAGTKPSGLGYTVTGTIDGSDVSFDTDAVMTDEPGRIVSEIRIVQGNTVIGTTNVVLSVEPNPHPDDTTDGQREPLINEITALLESITEQADRAEAVTKAVIDMTVTAHESDEATVTKTEGDVINLDFGLPRGETGATGPQGPQGETGPKGDKGDSGEVSLETLAKVMVSDTASGTIATFSDGSDVLPAKSVLVTLNPKQSGSGTPSPTNVRPISGWDEVETVVSGVNVWDEEWEVGGYAGATGNPWNTTDRIRSKTTNYISVVPNTSYRIYSDAWGSGGGKFFTVFFYDADKNYISYSDPNNGTTFTTPNSAHFVRFAAQPSYGTTYNNDISINYPSTDHDYHAYQGHTYTTDLPQTVYGGTLDVVSGVLTVDRAMVDLGSLNWVKGSSTFYTPFATGKYYGGCICSIYQNVNATYDQMADKTVCMGNSQASVILRIRDDSLISSDATAFKTAMNGVQLCYELATPTTIQCDPQTVQTLIGDNNVWGGSGVSIDYYADTKLYIEKMLGA